MKIKPFSQKRLKEQIDFLLEIDSLKTILRKTKILQEDRFEDAAQHSWHLALAAMILAEYANEKVNLSHVIKMLLLHDLIEIYCGDVFHYHKEADSQLASKEEEAAKKIFGLLPSDQGKKLLLLWMEFEKRETPEAKFATSIDRWMPMLLHCHSEHKLWKKYSLTPTEILQKNQQIGDGSSVLWQVAKEMISDASRKGYFS